MFIISVTPSIASLLLIALLNTCAGVFFAGLGLVFPVTISTSASATACCTGLNFSCNASSISCLASPFASLSLALNSSAVFWVSKSCIFFFLALSSLSFLAANILLPISRFCSIKSSITSTPCLVSMFGLWLNWAPPAILEAESGLAVSNILFLIWVFNKPLIVWPALSL